MASGLSTAQQAQILNTLASEGQLSGLNPAILSAIAQEESGDELAGAGINSAGYGGYFGLAPNKSYPGGQVNSADLDADNPFSFAHQAIVAASAFSSYLQQTGGNVAQAESMYQTGSPTGETGGGVSVVQQYLNGASPYAEAGQTAVSGSGTATGGSVASPTTTTANSTLAATDTQNLNIPGLGNTPATTQEATAYDTISADLQAYFDPTDAAALATWAWNKITTNEDPTQIAIDIQSTPQFLNAFPGFAPANAELQKNGLPAVSVQQYQQYQTQAMAMAQAAGLPTGFINSQNIGTLVGNNVSTTELSARLNDATTLAINSTPEQQQMFNQYFGTGYGDSGHGPLTTGQIAALALDPSVAEPLIAQQVTAAKIGGASVTSGVGALNVSTATQLAQAGITATQATSAFQNLAPYSALETARPGMGGEAAQGTITPDQIAQGQLLGSPAAQRQLQQAVEVAKAPFSGGGGFVGTSKGSAVGSANPNGTGNA